MDEVGTAIIREIICELSRQLMYSLVAPLTDSVITTAAFKLLVAATAIIITLIRWKCVSCHGRNLWNL